MNLNKAVADEKRTATRYPPAKAGFYKMSSGNTCWPYALGRLTGLAPVSHLCFSLTYGLWLMAYGLRLTAFGLVPRGAAPKPPQKTEYVD